MKNLPIALQMYTVREESQRDFFGTLERVAELGIDGVELAGYGNYSVREVKNRLDQLGLQVAANHISIADLQFDLTNVITEQKILDCNYLVCPYLPQQLRTEAGYKDLIPFLEKVGKACFAEGITFCYHNHDFELNRLADGRMALDAILQSTSSNHVKAEFDIYWLAKAGENPVEWIKRYHGRTPLVHLKDMITDEEQFFAELGTGGVDIDAVLELGDEADVKWWIVEQDESRLSPFESIEISMEYLRGKV
ncbi:TIM barrel protein [Virgibacillus dakarensis]|nr:TIM barrel protein [Virgibacillus dakarensis]